MLKLSIIILNYNTKDLTLNCINSIVDQYKKELDEGEFEIILVDNNSDDDSLKAFNRLRTKNLQIIESNENLGFAKGCNLGASKAKGDYLLFLNSDTEIKDQGFVKMVDFLDQNNNVAILGGKLKNLDGTSQLSTGKYYTLISLFLMLLGVERKGLLRESPNEIKSVDWVSGASLMIRKEVFNKIGGFEKELFMYIEDMELCYKARKKGLETYFYPNIMLFHKSLGSSNRSFAIFNIYKGILFFYKKHMPKWQYTLARLMLLMKARLLITFGKLQKNSYYISTYEETLKLF
jgi:GT2 family glycosyltransferase